MSPPAKQALKGSSHPKWFFVFAGLAVVAAIGAGFVGYDALSRAAPDPVFGWTGVGVAAALALAIFVVRMFVKSDISVDGDGVEMVRRGTSTKIRWAEPHDLYYRAFDGSGTPTVEKLTLSTPDGRRIEVDQVATQAGGNTNVPKLIEQYSSTANTPRLVARLDEGERVEFGAVSLSRSELVVGDHKVAMDGPVTLQIEAGQIKIGAKGGWTSSHVDLRNVANYACLLRAIGQVTHARAPV